jgi:hypothetical protein
MPFLYFDATPDHTAAEFGAPVPPGFYYYDGPELAEPIQGAFVNVVPATTRPEVMQGLAPAPILDFVAAHLARNPRGPYATEPEALERRIAYVRELAPPAYLPDPHPCTELDRRRCVLEMRAREIIETLALAPELAAEHGGIPLEIARRVAESERAIFEWDAKGRELDAEAEAKARREREEREAAKRAAREAAEPNDRTCAELGVIAIRVPCDAPANMIPRWLRSGNDVRGGHHHVHGGFRYWLVRASSLFGLSLPTTIRGTFAEVMPADHVPACMRGELSWTPPPIVRPRREDYANDLDFSKACGAAAWNHSQEMRLDPNRFRAFQDLDLGELALALATRKADASPISKFFDARTAEGRYRIELFAERVRTPLERTTDHYLTRVAVQIGVRGLSLRPDVVRGELARVAPNADLTPFDAMAAEAVSGRVALVSPDECYVHPPPGKLERIAIAMGQDPWRTTIKRITAGRSWIRVDELEAALMADGKIDAPLVPKGHARLVEAMRREGWEKRQGQIDGRRAWAYFPAAE